MFDLHITCTKDITFLKINFADGTSVVGENKDLKENSEKTYSSSNYIEQSNDTINQEQKFKKVKLPNIEDKHRDTVKVADELQDLEL